MCTKGIKSYPTLFHRRLVRVWFSRLLKELVFKILYVKWTKRYYCCNCPRYGTTMILSDQYQPKLWHFARELLSPEKLKKVVVRKVIKSSEWYEIVIQLSVGARSLKFWKEIKIRQYFRNCYIEVRKERKITKWYQVLIERLTRLEFGSLKRGIRYFEFFTTWFLFSIRTFDRRADFLDLSTLKVRRLIRDNSLKS